jgi:hypothetical protein
MTDIFQQALNEVGDLSGRLVQRGTKEEDAIAVAVALIMSAEMIYLHLGGPKLAAAQFEAVVERLRGDLL